MLIFLDRYYLHNLKIEKLPNSLLWMDSRWDENDTIFILVLRGCFKKFLEVDYKWEKNVMLWKYFLSLSSMFFEFFPPCSRDIIEKFKTALILVIKSWGNIPKLLFFPYIISLLDANFGKRFFNSSSTFKNTCKCNDRRPQTKNLDHIGIASAYFVY